MKNIATFGLFAALLAASCQRAPTPVSSSTDASAPSASPAETPTLAASISASPNPVDGGPEKGLTTITWDTHGNGAGEIYVSRNGAAEALFARGPGGSQQADWIQTGITYDFFLYQAPAHKLLSKVQVTHKH